MAPHLLAIAGAAGRMGAALIREAAGDARVDVAAAIEAPGHAALGTDAGAASGIDPISVPIVTAEDVALGAEICVIDFSLAAAAAENAERAAAVGAPLVIGATGFDEAQEARIARAAETTLIVKAGNMSLGVNLLARLVADAAKVLSPSHFDAEIAEAHHRRKVDAPSGTALMLADAVDMGRGDTASRESGDRGGARGSGDIGFAVSRGGGVIGDHSVAFVGDQEIVELRHRALDRSLFARGAIEAAVWASRTWAEGRRPGLHGMDPVIDSVIET